MSELDAQQRASSPGSAAPWQTSWHVAVNDLRLIFRDKATLFWSFVGPLLFITFFGMIFNSASTSGTGKVVMYLQNEDTNDLVANAMAILLSEQNIMVRTNAPGENNYCIVVPAGAGAAIAQGEPPRIVLRSPNESTGYREQAFLAAAYRGLLGTFMGLQSQDVQASLDSAAIYKRVVVPARVHLSEKGIQLETQGFQRALPAYLVMFLLMNSMIGGAILLISERKTGQLRRVMVSPVRPLEVILGKIFSRVLWSWSQILFIFLAGIFLYHVRFGDSPITLIVILLIFSLCATSLGLLFATFLRDPERAAGFGSLLVLLFSALGGLWWPIEVTPDWMQQLGGWVPTNWAFDALNRSMAFDVDLASLSRHLSYMGVTTLICLLLASARLQRSGQE